MTKQKSHSFDLEKVGMDRLRYNSKSGPVFHSLAKKKIDGTCLYRTVKEVRPLTGQTKYMFLKTECTKFVFDVSLRRTV